MRKFTRLTTVIVLLLLNFQVLKAQQNKNSIVQQVKNDSSYTIENPVQKGIQPDALDELLEGDKNKNYTEAGVSFINNNVYLGRQDSLPLPYITPSLGYYFKSGLFFDANVNYLVSPGRSRIDGATVEGGYQFSAGNYDGEFTASKYFYSGQSTNVKSEVSGSLSYYNDYDFGFIMPSLTTTLNFGKQTDFAVAFDVGHTIYLLDDGMEITPKVTLNGSTRNFYSNYYKNRKYKPGKKKKALPAGVASKTGVVVDAAAFKVFDYEMSLPINYQVNKFTFNVTPEYAMPVNPVMVDVTTTKTNGTVVQSTTTEKISNIFYFSIGVTYRFGGKK